MMKTKCFGLRPITGAGSDQANAADVDSPDAAPVVPVTSRDVSQPECAEIQEWQLENQGGGATWRPATAWRIKQMQVLDLGQNQQLV